MGGKMRGANLDIAQAAQTACRAEQLQLVCHGQAIARLHFDCRRAGGDKRVQARQGLRHDLVFGGGPGCRNRGKDSAAGTGDLFVACALKAHLELTGAAARIGQMSMAVDQTRGDQAAFGIVMRQVG